MEVTPCTCTYECEYICLPDTQMLSDEDLQELRRFAWRSHGVSYVNLLDSFRTGKYSVEFTGDDGCVVADIGEYLVYNKNLSRLDILTVKQFQQCCVDKGVKDA